MGFAVGYFALDWDCQVATCPAGYQSTGWTADPYPGTEHLVDSPVLAVSADGFVAARIRRVSRGADDAAPVLVDLEFNPRHPLIKRLSEAHATTPQTARLVAEQLLDNALLSAGLLNDPSAMVSRLNELLQHVG